MLSTTLNPTLDPWSQPKSKPIFVLYNNNKCTVYFVPDGFNPNWYHFLICSTNSFLYGRCENNKCVLACNPNVVPQGTFLTYDSYWKEGLGNADVTGRLQKFALLACKKTGEKLIASQVFGSKFYIVVHSILAYWKSDQFIKYPVSDQNIVTKRIFHRFKIFFILYLFF